MNCLHGCDINSEAWPRTHRFVKWTVGVMIRRSQANLLTEIYRSLTSETPSGLPMHFVNSLAGLEKFPKAKIKHATFLSALD